MKKAIMILAFSFFIINCSHGVPVRPSISPIAYQFTDDKIAGTIGILVHPDLSGLHQVVKPRSYQCSAWSFPLEVGDEISNAITKTIQNCFQKGESVDRLVPKSRFDGFMMVELIDFNVDLSFMPGFWSATADAFVEMNIKLTFYNKQLKPVWHSVVGYTKRKTDGAGGMCEGGATVISDSIERCVSKMTIQIAEKITSSDKLRLAIIGQQVKK